jgi:type IV secretion system protein TrbG
LRDRFRIFWAGVALLAGCAATTPEITSAPIPDDVGWTSPQVEAPAPLPPPPERPASRVEKVYSFEDGQEYSALVAVRTPLVVVLQAGERIADIGQDRSVIPESEEKSPWDIVQSVAYTPPRPVVQIQATQPGLSMGVNITTDKRIYLLNVRSVVASKIRVVRWDYSPDPVKTVAKTRCLPDPSGPHVYYGGYAIQPANEEKPPVWTPLKVVNDREGKTYIIFPAYLTTVSSPLLRLVESTGPRVVNYKQCGTVYRLEGLFDLAELRLGSGEHAEVVRIHRGPPQRIACPGDVNCPVWPDRLASQ